MARIIAIANQKGGVGKTTTAVNLAASLAVAEQRTLLVDGDPQGNATSGAGLTKGQLDLTVYEVLLGEATISEAIVRSVQFKHLDVLPATPDLAGAEVELVGRPNRDRAMRAALDSVRADYDYVLIDCPPSLGLITVNMLAAADSVLIPLQTEYFALEGISQLLNTVNLVQRGINERLAVDGVLLTMYDPRLNLSRQVAADAREFFGAKVYQTIIPRNVRLAEAPSFGKPIILYDLASVGAQAYVNLAKEFLERQERQEPQEPQEPQEREQSPTAAVVAEPARAPAPPPAAVTLADVPATLVSSEPAAATVLDTTPLGNHHEHGQTSAPR